MIDQPGSDMPLLPSDQERRWRTERVGRDLDRKSDMELIGEVATGGPAPHTVNPMELSRRLKDSIADLTAEVKAARESSDRLGKILIWLTGSLVVLTVLLIGLTVVLVVLTVKLANGG